MHYFTTGFNIAVEDRIPSLVRVHDPWLGWGGWYGIHIQLQKYARYFEGERLTPPRPLALVEPRNPLRTLSPSPCNPSFHSDFLRRLELRIKLMLLIPAPSSPPHILSFGLVFNLCISRTRIYYLYICSASEIMMAPWHYEVWFSIWIMPSLSC